MALAVDGAAASTHGKTHHRTLSLGPAATILLLHGRHELLEEIILIAPARLIEIAVEGIVHIPAAGSRHHDNHRTHLARAHQLVGHDLHLPLVAPGGIVVAKAMQQVNHGIAGLALLKAVGQVNVILHLGTEHLAVKAVGNDLSGPGGQEGKRRNGEQQILFHSNWLLTQTLHWYWPSRRPG